MVLRNLPFLNYLNMESSFSLWSNKKVYHRASGNNISGWFRGQNPRRIIHNLPSFGNIPQMSKTQFEIIKNLRDNIKASIDQRSGVISISAEFPDPRVAAQIGQHSVNYLTDYITQYRIGKAQKDLDFIKDRYEDKKNEFHLSQLALANFRDANRNFVSLTAQTEEQRLQDQYNLAFNVFNSLAQQVEQARIKVQEETPVIKFWNR
jgi:capsule polysaccharide export protein KpsE/RkpR